MELGRRADLATATSTKSWLQQFCRYIIKLTPSLATKLYAVFDKPKELANLAIPDVVQQYRTNLTLSYGDFVFNPGESPPLKGPYQRGGNATAQGGATTTTTTTTTPPSLQSQSTRNKRNDSISHPPAKKYKEDSNEKYLVCGWSHSTKECHVLFGIPKTRRKPRTFNYRQAAHEKRMKTDSTHKSTIKKINSNVKSQPFKTE